MAKTLKLTPSESVTIAESTPEMLEVTVEYGPGGSPPPKHFHVVRGDRRAASWRARRQGRDAGPARLRRAAHRVSDVFRLAVAPDAILRPALAALGAVGRARGYEAKPGGG